MPSSSSHDGRRFQTLQARYCEQYRDSGCVFLKQILSSSTPIPSLNPARNSARSSSPTRLRCPISSTHPPTNKGRRTTTYQPTDTQKTFKRVLWKYYDPLNRDKKKEDWWNLCIWDDITECACFRLPFKNVLRATTSYTSMKVPFAAVKLLKHFSNLC